MAQEDWHTEFVHSNKKKWKIDGSMYVSRQNDSCFCSEGNKIIF